MLNIFEVDSLFNRAMGRVADFMIINLLFILTSLPIITVGSSLTAMYHVWFTYSDHIGENQIKRYFEAFKKNFRQSTLFSVVLLLLFIVYGASLMAYPEYQGGFRLLIIISLIAFTTILFMFSIVIFAYLAKFHDQTRVIVANSFKLMIRHIGSLVVITVNTILPFILMHQSPELFVFGLYLFMFIGFSMITYVNAKVIDGVFGKYIGGKDIADS